MNEHASIDTVRDARDQILREMAAGFQGVHERQDEANGRTRTLEQAAARYDERLKLLEAERETSHMHRRATDPKPVTADVEVEKRPVTRWDVALVAGSFGGLFGILKFLEWLRSVKP